MSYDKKDDDTDRSWPKGEKKAKFKTETSHKVRLAEKLIEIAAPNFGAMETKIIGSSAYVSNRFSQRDTLMADRERTAEQIQKDKNLEKSNRKPANYQKRYENSKHVSEEGWCGIPCAAFRSAMISACRLVNYKMTIAKLSIFVLPDGIDRDEGTPLVRIYGKVERNDSRTRNDDGSLGFSARAMWREWYCKLRLQWDADQFSDKSILNLLARVGMQVGVGEGRHDSRSSNGMGWGTFAIDRGGRR